MKCLRIGHVNYAAVPAKISYYALMALQNMGYGNFNTSGLPFDLCWYEHYQDEIK